MTVLDSLKKHDEAQVLVEEIHGKSDIQSVAHNVRFVKNYQKGKSDLLLWFEKNTEKREGAYLMNFMNLSDHHDFERYVIELCHVEYKLGNKETALTYLYNLVDFDPSSMIIYLFSDNERYWCFFLDLYDSYPNDYRVHVIAAYLYNQDAHELVDQKFNDKVICKLPFLKSIPYGSHDSYEKEIRKRALGEIEIAEKLSHNEFYLLKGRIHWPMGEKEKGLEQVNRLIAKEPNNSNAYYLKSLLLEPKGDAYMEKAVRLGFNKRTLQLHTNN